MVASEEAGGLPGSATLTLSHVGKLRLAAWLGAFAGSRPLALRFLHLALRLQPHLDGAPDLLGFGNAGARLDRLQPRRQVIVDREVKEPAPGRHVVSLSL
jgi:hypothetical protein